MSERLFGMAKPGIPVETPRKRDIPDIPNPIPERALPDSNPAPAAPVGPQREPVPAKS